MAKNTKTVRKGFDYRSCDDFAAYLNHMARRGWHFKEWRAGLVFEQGEPENAVYAVEIFTKAEESDTRPLPETQEFAEYCAAAGWEFVDAWRKFVVFKRLRPDAVPIMTDQERFENAEKASAFLGYYPLIHTFIWCVMETVELATMFPYRIFSTLHLILMAVWYSLFLMTALRAIHFLLWKRQCRRRLDQGLPLFLGKSQADRWFSNLYLLVYLLTGLSMFLVGQPLFGMFLILAAAASLLPGYIIAKLRPDSATAGVIQILGSIAVIVGMLFAVFYVQEEQRENERIILAPPLTFADLGIDMEEPEIRYSRREESIFGYKRLANLDYGDEYLYYHLYTTEHEWVLDKLWKEETKGRVNDLRCDCTAAWGAVEAFRNNAGNYLVRYRDALWVICPSLEEPFTQEQIDMIVAALKGG